MEKEIVNYNILRTSKHRKTEPNNFEAPAQLSQRFHVSWSLPESLICFDRLSLSSCDRTLAIRISFAIQWFSAWCQFACWYHKFWIASQQYTNTSYDMEMTSNMSSGGTILKNRCLSFVKWISIYLECCNQMEFFGEIRARYRSTTNWYSEFSKEKNTLVSDEASIILIIHLPAPTNMTITRTKHVFILIDVFLIKLDESEEMLQMESFLLLIRSTLKLKTQ